jgi:hypothetical protein
VAVHGTLAIVKDVGHFVNQALEERLLLCHFSVKEFDFSFDKLSHYRALGWHVYAIIQYRLLISDLYAKSEIFPEIAPESLRLLFRFSDASTKVFRRSRRRFHSF